MAYRQGYRPASVQQAQKARQTKQNAPAPAPRTAQARPRKAKKKRGRPFRVFFALVLCALVATAGVMIYMMYDEVNQVEKADTFYPNVFIDGVSLNKATREAAYSWLLEQARKDMVGWSITLQYGDHTWLIDTQLLGLDAALEQTVMEEVQKAYMVGRSGDSIIDRYRTILELKSEPYHGYTSGIEKNTAPIDAIIAEIQALVSRAPQDATLAFNFTRKNDPVVITPEVNGLELDAGALKSQLVDMVNRLESGTVNIEPKVTMPAVTASMLEGQIVLLGNFESAISSRSTDSRNRNVELGCERINETVLQDGERFSFNKKTGRRTKENGFQQAEEIVSGSYEMGWGGGICQVSSGLYNAVVQANLKVRERHNHGIPVNYLEMGADATVYDDRYDLVFENNTGAPVYIIARMESSGGKLKCVFQIYGRPEPNGYTYSMRHETINIIPIPEPIRVKDTKEEHVKYIGDEKQVSNGQEGAVVRTYLVIKDAYGKIISDDQEMYTDTYKAQAPRIYEGVNRRPD